VPVQNSEIAQIFNEVADLLEIEGLAMVSMMRQL